MAFLILNLRERKSALLGLFLSAAVCMRGRSAPANDNFTNRTVITGSAVTISGTLAGATLEDAETGSLFDSQSGGSVWYTWTAAQSGNVVIELVRDYNSFSASNTTFYACTGSDIGALTLVDGNNFDWPPGRYSAFTATAGTSYQFRVAGGWGGPFFLKLTATNPPVFLKQPVDCAVSPFGSAFFSALAAGPRSWLYAKSAMSYQWLSNGVPIPGETGASLLLNEVTSNSTATYSVIASNAGGVTESSSATFSIIDTNPVPRLLALRSANPTQVALTLTGEGGRWYQVESSQDFSNWPSLMPFPHTNQFSFYATHQSLSLTLPRLLPVQFVRASLNFRTDICVGQLKQMFWAQQLAAIDNNLGVSDQVFLEQLKPYIPLGPADNIRSCPEYGTYYTSFNGTITNPIACTLSESGHTIAGPP